MSESPLLAPQYIGATELLIILGALLIIVGIILAFRGRRIWAGLMSLIGAIIGGAIGYIFGLMLNSWIAALILSILGAFIGSILFGYLVKIALAFVTALLIAGAFYITIGAGMDLDARMIVSVIILLIVYAIAYWFIQEIIAFITALLGGILIGAGVYLVGLGATAALALGGLSFLAGFIIQTIDYHRSKKKPEVRTAQQTYYYTAPVQTQPQPAPPPPPPPPEEEHPSEGTQTGYQ